MCGLVAAQLKRPWLTKDRLDAALESIAHRGPDGRSSWYSHDRLTVMGHVRLSIIGLENGTQPLGHARGDLNLVVNGEFYRYKAIRTRLRGKGYHFTTDSDSEIALHLYDECGLDFVNQLRGEFALVLSDRRSGELIAARDRFGIKPLFYTVLNGEVLFASECKALVALGVPARWDTAGILGELSGMRTNASLFANIQQVPPGCLVIAKNGQVRVQRYWEPVYPTSAMLAREERSEAEIIQGFRAVLDDAVAERLTADVEVACYLSGGLDSSAVLGLAQARIDRPIRAFTIAFEGAFDESPLAERTAAFTGSKYYPVPVTAQTLAEALEETVWHCERPIINANCAAKFLLSRAVHDAGIKVVFTGSGSDEILAGYMWERRDLMLYSRPYATDADRQAALAALIAANPRTAPFMLQQNAPAVITRIMRDAIGFCPSWIECFSAHCHVMSGLMRPDAPGIDTLELPYHALLSELDIDGRICGRDPVNISLYLWQRTMLINYILTGFGDRMEMAHSIEGRVPFLDHHVSEYAASLPVHYKLRESTEKFVLREATRDVLTPEIYARPKAPFIAPPLRTVTKTAKRDPLQECCEDIIRSRSFSDQPFFDQAKACAFLDSLTDADTVRAEQASPIVLQLATFSLLQNRFCGSA